MNKEKILEIIEKDYTLRPVTIHTDYQDMRGYEVTSVIDDDLDHLIKILVYSSQTTVESVPDGIYPDLEEQFNNPGISMTENMDTDYVVEGNEGFTMVAISKSQNTVTQVGIIEELNDDESVYVLYGDDLTTLIESSSFSIV